MSGTYNPLLVFVSFVVAFLASYTAVELSGRISSLQQARRRTSWLVGGALAMGIGIWSMHFIGMLAFALPIPVGYDLSTTAASLLIAVWVSFLALSTVTRGTLSRVRLGAAGILMGLGIAGMHYTGMAAMQMSPPIRYTFWILMASVAIAIAASIAALWIAFTLRTPEQQNLVFKRLGSAMVMGLAITGMHYTGMDAANFEAGSICLAADKLDTNWLALLVSTSSFTVLIGTLVFLGFSTSSLSNSLKRANDDLRQRGAELERAIQSLRDSQQLLQSIVDNAGTMIYVKHLSGRYLLVNRRYEEIYHATVYDLLGKTDYDLFPKEHADACRAIDERVAAGEVVEAEEAVALPDGLHTYISVKFPVRDSADRIVAVAGISTDITERKKSERAVRDSEERTRLIVDSALDAVITMNREGAIIGWNPQASATFGWAHDDVLGRSLSETIIPPRHREAHVRGLGRYLATGEAVVLHKRVELSAMHRDGHEFPIELTITPIGIGERLCFSAFLRDITERKEAERAMRDSEKRFRAAFEQAAVGIAHVSPDGRWLRVNQKLCDIVGYTRDELSSLTFQDITHADDLDIDLAQMHQVLEGQLDTYTLEKRYLKKDGSPVWINLTVALVREEAGKPDYFISVVEDIQRRKRAEEELLARTEALRLSREELRRLSGHVQHVREEEKTRIARELHDELGQQLVALKMLVTLTEQTLSAAAPPSPAQALQGVYVSIDQMVESVRRIAADLRPVMLDDLGLIPAIEWFINEFSRRHKVRVVTRIDVGGIDFNRESATTVYRIVQEAMTNVARHSGATVVKLDIVREDPHCVMSIADNGHGVATEARVRRNSLGLIGLRERVARLGGDLQIVTSSGAGFTLTATLPIAAVQATAQPYGLHRAK